MKTRPRAKGEFFKTSRLAAILFIGAFITFLFTQIPQNFIKRVQLISFYSNLTSYEKSFNYEGIYELLTPDYRRNLPLKNFLVQRSQASKPFNQEFKVHSYKIDGNKGLVDRTLIICNNTDCTGMSRHESRTIKEYLYLNWQWYIPEDNSVLCTRNEPYPMSPEFERAVSLLIQRLSQSNTAGYLDENILKIKNCLNITYSPEVEKYDAEGLFYFDENSTNDKLNILVSNRYRISDDIVTALLLSHEITHAYIFASGLDLDCYQNEAEAFTNELYLLTGFNQAERDILAAKFDFYPSPQTDSFYNMIKKVNRMKGTPYENILQIVKSDPYYQKQCVSN